VTLKSPHSGLNAFGDIEGKVFRWRLPRRESGPGGNLLDEVGGEGTPVVPFDAQATRYHRRPVWTTLGSCD
jgi:hypothetical protein